MERTQEEIKNIMHYRAKDIMTKNVIRANRNTSVLEVIEIMAENNITGIPVVEKDMTLVGVLTEKDVMRLLLEPDDEKYKPVEDFMTQPAVFFDENEKLQDICNCLMNNDFRRVAVTSNGKLVGIISRRDIIREYIIHRKKNSGDSDYIDFGGI